MRARLLSTFGVVFANAAVLRLMSLPDARHRWEGHEAAYVSCLDGVCEGASGAQTVAPLRLLARGLGIFTQDPLGLEICALAMGWLSIAAVMYLAYRIADTDTAFVVGSLLCIWGEHLAWSGAYYQVVAPQALMWGGLAVWTHARVSATVLGSLLVALGLSCRVELLPLALLAPLWVGTAARSGRWRVAWVIALVVGVCAHPAVGVEEGVLISSSSHAMDALTRQVFWTEYAGPWMSPEMLLVVLWASWRVWGERRQQVIVIWATVLAIHVTGASFVDWGYRHELAAGSALALLVAMAVSAGVSDPGGRKVVSIAALVVVFAVLIRDTLALSTRYYASESAVSIERLKSAVWTNTSSDEPFEGCRFLSEEPPVPGQALPSHWEVDLGEGCWLWGEEFWHHTWNSRALAARGERMHRLYQLQPVAVREWSDDPGRPRRWVYRVLERR